MDAEAVAAKAKESRGDDPPATPNGWRSNAPQALACVVAGLFNFSEGLSFAFSSSLIPSLQREDSDVPVSLEQGVLLASCLTVAMSIGTFFGGVTMNFFGRLNTIRLCALPFTAGWFLVATASSFEQILIGRIFTGLANPLGINAAVVFTTEIASGHMRGALNSTHTAMASLGMVAMYVLGAVTDWRTSAWISGSSTVVTVGLTYLCCSESPIWLVSKGREDEALRSLQSYARAVVSKDEREALPERQLKYLIQRRAKLEAQQQDKAPWYRVAAKLFTTPAGIKPLFILLVTFFAQNFSGVYITLFYAAPFFQEMGVEVDAFQSAIYLGVTRFLVGVLAVFLLRIFGVRKLMVGSSVGMAVSMALSGFFTLRPEYSLGGWVPVGLVLMYVVFSGCGLLTVPWTMTAEMYPDQLRDIGQTVTLFGADSLMTAALQLYPNLKEGFKTDAVPGIVGLQWFFAAVALASSAFSFVFIPETRGMTLSDIEEHFKLNTAWLRRKHAQPS